jgi:hypothetical protein
MALPVACFCRMGGDVKGYDGGGDEDLFFMDSESILAGSHAEPG